MSKNKQQDVEETQPGEGAQETGETVKKYRVVAPAKGFRRAGRLWQGVTEVPADELTAEQVEQIKAEPRLTIAEV